MGMPQAVIAPCQTSLQLWSTCLELFFVWPCFCVCVPVTCDILTAYGSCLYLRQLKVNKVPEKYSLIFLTSGMCHLCRLCCIFLFFVFTVLWYFCALMHWCFLSVFYCVFLIVAKLTYWEKCLRGTHLLVMQLLTSNSCTWFMLHWSFVHPLDIEFWVLDYPSIK